MMKPSQSQTAHTLSKSAHGTITSSSTTSPAVDNIMPGTSVISSDLEQMSSRAVRRRRENSPSCQLSSPPIKLKRTITSKIGGAANTASVQKKSKPPTKRRLFSNPIPTNTTTSTNIAVTTSKFYSKGRAMTAHGLWPVNPHRQPKMEVLHLENSADIATASNSTSNSIASATNTTFAASSSISESISIYSNEGTHLGEVDIQQPDYGRECSSKSPLLYSSPSPSPQMSPLMDSPSSPILILESPALVSKSYATGVTIQGRPPKPDISTKPTIPSIFMPPVVKSQSTAGNITQTAVPAQQVAKTSEEQSSAPASSGSSTRRSQIWNHFVANGDGRIAKCKLCSREVSRGQKIGHLTNAGMNQHMRSHHKPVLLREEHGVASTPCTTRGSSALDVAISTTQAKAQISHATSVTASSSSSHMSHTRHSTYTQATLEQVGTFHSKVLSRQQSRKVTRLIAQLIAVGGAPFNLVEGEPFKQLMQALAPGYKVPSRTTFSRTVIPSLYSSCVGVLKEELAKAPGQLVHFTTDIWSAPSGQHAFLSLTAHWWQPKVPQDIACSGPRGSATLAKQGHRSFLLHAEVMDEQHTSHNILQSLKRMVAQWLGEQAGTHAEMGFVVTDGGANMLKAVRDGKYVSVRCSAHLLNLVVKDALSEDNTSGKLATLLDSCRKIAAHFHRSVKDSNILRKEQKKQGLNEHRLKIDVVTRWNSTLDMLERILEQQKALHAMSNEHYIGIDRPLAREDWAMIAQLVSVLKPFKAVTEQLSQESASISEVVPLVTYLVNNIDALLSYKEVLPGGHVPEVMALLKRCKVELNRRLKNLTDSCPEVMLATLCDPRMKGKMALTSNSLTFWRDKLVERVREKHYKISRLRREEEDEEAELEENESVSLSSSHSNSATTPQSTSVLVRALGSVVGPIRLPSHKKIGVQDMVTTYLAEAILPPTVNPLEFWDDKRDIWPALSQVAQELLSCPPTSVQSERVFSVTGNILCPQRSQLAPQLMEKLAFLKVNLPKLEYPVLSYDTE
ncbi:zinc finger BED domain-containing protein 4-like [Rana temporaria]|uniref:zinc finger BED domain-containing protein 4-like n=1 Tax=Rana temporaria TaxID=8407 RepID=UPI001AADEAB9|nr:zinc finger BED domain-containing protein 4-like [Rana temporaria]XP_040190708.1 zinc finger BED domain-containing protein 4-like [Rana temporaria]